jgi:osmotically-inducible protein OsmY
MSKEDPVKRLFSSMALTASLAAVPMMSMMSACAKTPETPDYQERVNDSLESANLADVNADWKTDENALHLTGEVSTAAEKARAEELAQQVVGTSGRVVNEVTVEGMNAGEVDDRIERDLDRSFREDDEFDMDTMDLSFDSKAGVVTVTGDAPTQALKDGVTKKVRTIDGVKDVVNNLEIKPAPKK